MTPGTDLDLCGVLDVVATTACEDLFARYGVSARRVSDDAEPREPDFYMCAIIGFSGRDVSGTLILAVTEEISDRSNPLYGAGAHAEGGTLRRDWVGELANQLLGRIKRELLRHGVEIHLNLPAVLRGRHLAPLPRKELLPMKFALAGGAAAVWLEVESPAGFKLGATSSDETGASAGDSLSFD